MEKLLRNQVCCVPYLGTSQAEKEKVLALERRVESEGKGCHVRPHAPEATSGELMSKQTQEEKKEQAMETTGGRKFQTWNWQVKNAHLCPV